PPGGELRLGGQLGARRMAGDLVLILDGDGGDVAGGGGLRRAEALQVGVLIAKQRQIDEEPLVREHPIPAFVADEVLRFEVPAAQYLNDRTGPDLTLKEEILFEVRGGGDGARDGEPERLPLTRRPA